MGQVLHLAAPHGRLPGSSYDIGVKDTHTSPLKFCGQQKEMSVAAKKKHEGRKGVIWHLNEGMVEKDGRKEWYITTKVCKQTFPGSV